jgi:hypothetical protein
MRTIVSSVFVAFLAASSLLGQSNSLAAPGSLGRTALPKPASSFEVVLTRTLDARKSRVGDVIIARVSEDVRTRDGAQIPKNAKLIGHLTLVQAKGRGSSDSRLGVLFDKAQMRDGREVSLNLAIQSVIPMDEVSPDRSGPDGKTADLNTAKTVQIEPSVGDASQGSILRSNAENLRVESGARFVLSVIQQ